MIVLWKFSKEEKDLPKGVKWHEEQGVAYIDSLSVAEDEKAFLTPIILSTEIIDDKNFKAILDCAVDKAKGVEHIILVHKNTKVSGCEITEDKILSNLPKGYNYALFGGGSGTIYETLLFQENTFIWEAFDSNGKLKKAVFDAIWNEYNVKKKIVRLKFDILSKCLPLVIDIRGLKDCTGGGDSTKTIEYLSIIQANKNWSLPSKILLDECNCPSEELRDEINQAIGNILSLGKIIEVPSTTPQDILNIMYSKQFNIDDWYSNLVKYFEK